MSDYANALDAISDAGYGYRSEVGNGYVLVLALRPDGSDAFCATYPLAIDCNPHRSNALTAAAVEAAQWVKAHPIEPQEAPR